MQVFAIVGGAVCVLALGWFGGTSTLGAHPFWAMQVAFIGAGIAVVLGGLAVVLNIRPTWLKLGTVIVAIAGFVSASWGKMEFAASYAENAFAGQAWYFGWIIGLAAIAMFIGAQGMARR